jgi:hypothetical protein
MRIPSSFYCSAAVAGLAFAAGCGSDSATSPTQSSAGLSSAISQVTVVDANTFSSARAMTNISSGANATPAFDPASCTYSSSDNAFTCPSKSASGLTFQLKFFLFDASNQPMSSYDAATTASLRAVYDASGTFSNTGSTPSTLQLTHHSDLTLTGLLGTSRTLNGTSSDHGVFDTGSGTSAVHAVADAAGTATNVVLPAAQGQYPESGLLASDITVATTSGSFSTTANARGTLAFNGTNFALLTLASGSGTAACTIDLSGATAPRC